MNKNHQYVAVIPCHNEAETIGRVVRQVLCEVNAAIVVDDGSTDGTAAFARAAGASVLSISKSGKGTALRAGMDLALAQGATHAVCLDGDGQHLPAEAPRLLTAADDGDSMIVGNRMQESSRMPFVRRWTNRIMSRVLSLLTGTTLPDSQCGFRVIPLVPDFLVSLKSRHFEIESELILRARQFGLGIRHVPVSCIYDRERSHIRAVTDTVRWFRWLWQTSPAQSKT